ncbi:MAG: anthranilate synthase component I [Candidatus Symbiobacter sp.]|nr:anthranilate synthase component I [Candidatus Symbiobacter sp.]
MTEDPEYRTKGGITIQRKVDDRYPFDLTQFSAELNHRRGVLLSSNYEVTGRYKRWSLAAIDPPLAVTVSGSAFSVTAFNPRGEILLSLVTDALQKIEGMMDFAATASEITGRIPPSTTVIDESERGKQESVFSVLRAIIDLFYSTDDTHLGLYGAFGYDLVFQFDPMELTKTRPPHQRDLVLYLPDQITVIDHRMEQATRLSYEFTVTDAQGKTHSTQGIPRQQVENFRPTDPRPAALPTQSALPAQQNSGSLPEGGYADIVREAFAKFRQGDLFEVVPSHCFYEKTRASPSELFQILTAINPSPYGFLINLGLGEFLVGASPEMFVRVKTKDGKRRIETCPISGTIRRGADAIEDAENIRTLLNSVKDETELTMCTDVDRNDKARICEPGSVQVIGRRQIELYSHLIHTVDHVEGILRDGFDGLDAFLSHMWAVTVTGAPKRAAIQFIEQREPGLRHYYGGAVGCLGFNGDINTGLTLRTMRLLRDDKGQGLVEIRAGATLLADSDPDAEEAETVLKAAALRQTVQRANQGGISSVMPKESAPAMPVMKSDRQILMVDCEDSFVHTLAMYFRQTGAEVMVARPAAARAIFPEFCRRYQTDGKGLLVLSPGPGRPSQFGLTEFITLALTAKMPIFGVCLGLQAIVEALGGRLGVLPIPFHGRSSEVIRTRAASRLFTNMPQKFTVGRYHSLFAESAHLPSALTVTATSQDGVIMAAEHHTLPIAGVQFHPESLMTAKLATGSKIIENVVNLLR